MTENCNSDILAQAEDRPTPEMLRNVFAYDPLTGLLTWKVSRGTVKAGSSAGAPLRGYMRVKFLKKNHFVHRIAWAIQTGSWPEEHIDHINRNSMDNRFCNLRAVSIAENNANKGSYRTNLSGAPGVAWSRSKRRWVSYVCQGGGHKWVGTFKTKDEAIEARRVALENPA